MQDTSTNPVKLPKLAKTRTNHVVNYNFKNLSRLLQGNSQDEDIVLEAIEVGYLLYPSKDFIWKIYEKQNDYDPIKSQKPVKNYRSRYYQEEIMANDYTTIKFLNMCNIPVIEIGDICLCQNLRILNLSSNYLISIDSLAICINLIRIDLQNNQVMNYRNKFELLKFLKFILSNKDNKSTRSVFLVAYEKATYIVSSQQSHRQTRVFKLSLQM
jgi:Leucine-rich repeat (LRR) protein